MSFPSFAPGAMPRPIATPRRAATPQRAPWGWLEWFLIAQTFIPAMLFLPGISSIRFVIRVASFLYALFVWWMIVQSGQVRSGSQSFPATKWLKLSIGVLLLLLFHWNSNSPQSAFAQVVLYVAVFSPAFWAASALKSSKQLGRLMTIMLICNGLSALVGLGQVFRPQTFNPPFIPGVTDSTVEVGEGSAAVLSYKDEYGRTIVRPCGLSDMVGSAAGAGAAAALIGLAYFLRPIGTLKRLLCLGLAFCGVAVIYYSQVRQMLVMLIICLLVLMALFSAQRNLRHAMVIGVLGAVMIAGALSWVMATSGMVVVERFLGLASENFTESYAKSRGGYVRFALTEEIWANPVGVGLGWWGTIYGTLGDKSKPNPYWVEVMISAWVYDGGFPLLILYVGAIVVTMFDTLRIALRTKDPELKFWAAVVFASNLSVIATCFSYVTFVATIGMQFWLLSAVVHAADCRFREEAAAAARVRLAGSQGQVPAPSAPPPPRPFPAAPPPGYPPTGPGLAQPAPP
jgi:hypothetical protein